jgi:hypothetical protein
MSKLIAMSALIATVLFGNSAAASAACQNSITEFEAIIASDAKTGNLNKGVSRRIAAELTSVQATCAAGRDADAIRQLGAIKHRFGYR